MFGMDRRTDGQMDTSSPLLAHFRSTSGHFQSTSGSLPVHLGTIGGHMRHHSYSLPKKMKFPKFADGHTDGRTEKKVTPKDPLRINARDLKIRELFFSYLLQTVLDDATTAWGIKVERVEM